MREPYLSHYFSNIYIYIYLKKFTERETTGRRVELAAKASEASLSSLLLSFFFPIIVYINIQYMRKKTKTAVFYINFLKYIYIFKENDSNICMHIFERKLKAACFVSRSSTAKAPVTLRVTGHAASCGGRRTKEDLISSNKARSF